MGCLCFKDLLPAFYFYFFFNLSSFVFIAGFEIICRFFFVISLKKSFVAFSCVTPSTCADTVLLLRTFALFHW